MSELFDETCPCCGQPVAPKQQQSGSFQAFWAAVPHKVGKAASEKAWRKLTSADRLAATESVAVFYKWFAATYPTASAIHPASYLNGRRWEDEPIKSKGGAVTVAAMESLRKALASNIPSVREHAEKIMARIGGDA